MLAVHLLRRRAGRLHPTHPGCNPTCACSQVQLLDAEPRDRPSDARAVRALVAALRVNATLPTPLATLRLDNNGLGPTAVDRLRRAAVRGSGDGELKLTA